MTVELRLKSGVVSASDFVEFEWRESPLFSDTVVSEHGHVALRTGINTWEYKLPEVASSWFSDYYVSKVKLKNGNKYQQLLHVIVALVFYGEVPNWSTLGVVVNHKDGNKRNNHYSNLEWCTRGENQIHAYETGLRNDGCNIEVTDHETGQVQVYPTIASVAREFNVSKSFSNAFCHKYRIEKYLGRYTFERKDENRKTLKKAWVKTIYALDYKSKALHVADDSGKLEKITNISRQTMLYNLREKKTALVNGWVFSYDSNVFPSYTDEEVKHSIEAWTNKKVPREKIFGVEVKNYVTDEVTKYSDMLKAGEANGLPKGNVAYMANSETPKLIRGIIVRYPSDDPWPIYDERHISASAKYRKECQRVLEITDLVAKTTEYYGTIHSFAIEAGFNPVTTSNWYRENPDKPYKARYLIRDITENLSSPIA